MRTRVPVARGDGTRFTLTLTRAVAPGAPSAIPAGPTPVVLVVPAMGMPAGYYAPFAGGLAAAGLHAAVSEQRGHEQPPGPRPGRRYDFGYAEIAADIGRAAGVLAREFPGAPVVVVGHSMGGHAAVAHLGTGGEREVAGLVLLASGSVWWKAWPVPVWQLVRTQAALLLTLALGHFPGERVGFAGREARGVVRDWARFARCGRLATGRPPREHGPALRHVRLPLLVISLAGDVLSPRRSCAAMADLLPAADVTLAHLRPGPGDDAVDHFRWARHPALVLGTLVPWVARSVCEPVAETPRGAGDPVVRSPVHERGGGPRNAWLSDS